MRSKKTWKELTIAYSLRDTAATVHPRHPVMALGYIIDKQKLGVIGRKNNVGVASLKRGFWENASLLEEVGRVGGMLIASFLYPQKVPAHFVGVNDGIDRIKTGGASIVKGEIREIFKKRGSMVNVDEFTRRAYFKDVMMKISSRYSDQKEKARFEGLSRDGVLYSETVGDIVGRKEDVQEHGVNPTGDLSWPGGQCIIRVKHIPGNSFQSTLR